MANLQVSDTNVPGLLKRLKSGEYLSPQFQRDFVWSRADVISLVNSIIDAKPVGMITLWEQEDNSQLELEHVSISDWDYDNGKTGLRPFGNPNDRPGRYYAILDGRQRSTAIALAFGGLKAISKLYKTAGRYFLDVASHDTLERVRFISDREVEDRGLDRTNVAIGAGLFPLAVDDPDKIYSVWMDYIQNIGDSQFYKDGILPDEPEMIRRNGILRDAFNGIINTKIAIYTVPESYSLSEICEIFETLNTTGTKVSTVDLIHSWVYSDTASSDGGPIHLRQLLDELGEYEGAVGWASSRDRPELTAQLVAACHISLNNKPEPRQITGNKKTRITSVKAQDLLAIPTEFWRHIFENADRFARAIGDFQKSVSGGLFDYRNCPYPASAAIYVGLKWHMDSEPADTRWSKKQLDDIFRAFFWRNSILNRYDQGFLTQIGTDIRALRDFLDAAPPNISHEDWSVGATRWLNIYFGEEDYRPRIEDIITDGRYAGATRRIALLPLYARATLDPINPELKVGYPSNDLDLHHIYPRDWCQNNRTINLAKVLNIEVAERDYPNAVVNLIPMHRKTNLNWRKQIPAQYLNKSGLEYADNKDVWQAYFISERAFRLLQMGPDSLEEFWHERKRLIADYMVSQTIV